MIKPIYSKFDHASERWIFGLNEEDFGKVQAGYACGECLEDYNGIWRPSCPVCGHGNKVIVSVPEEWKR